MNDPKNAGATTSAYVASTSHSRTTIKADLDALGLQRARPGCLPCGLRLAREATTADTPSRRRG